MCCKCAGHLKCAVNVQYCAANMLVLNCTVMYCKCTSAELYCTVLQMCCPFIFSRESDSRIANVCLSQKTLSLSKLIATIEPIDHEPINLWSSFATFNPFGLFEYEKNYKKNSVSKSSVNIISKYQKKSKIKKYHPKVYFTFWPIE